MQLLSLQVTNREERKLLPWSTWQFKRSKVRAEVSVIFFSDGETEVEKETGRDSCVWPC